MTDTLRSFGAKELAALAMLDDGADLEEIMEMTKLTREQIVDANNLRMVKDRANGGLVVLPDEEPAGAVAAIDGPAPVAPVAGGQSDTIAALLERAAAVGGVHAQFLVGRINADLLDLSETLAEDEATYAARRRVDAARAELEAAEASLRELAGAPAPLRVAVKKTAKKAPAKKTAARKRAAVGDLPYSQRVREWARANGHEVGGHGRMKNEVVEAYRAAQAEGGAANATAG